ncbi:hypothetical protein Hanom_Chr10g00878781 [Helianthus anomalus]
MDGANEPDENGKISNLLHLDAEKQTFRRKSQNLPNLRDEIWHFTLILIIRHRRSEVVCIQKHLIATELNQ